MQSQMCGGDTENLVPCTTENVEKNSEVADKET